MMTLPYTWKGKQERKDIKVQRAKSYEENNNNNAS